MDGLSNDKTLQIAEKYGDSRIRIYSEKDEGIYDAMNKGIRLAQGEWLYFLGSDDALFDNQVLGVIRQHIRNSRRKIVYGNVAIVGDSGWSEGGKVYDGRFDLKKLLQKNICHQAIFYHRSVFEKSGNYTIRYKLHADYDFNLNCFATYKFLYVDLLVAKFQGGGTSFSLTQEDEKYGIERWTNISNYFQWRLYKKAFFPYVNNLDKYGKKNSIVKMQLLYIKIRMGFVKLIKRK
jgi:glycosyltransferase involved in cell wall biosynthesis